MPYEGSREDGGTRSLVAPRSTAATELLVVAEKPGPSNQRGYAGVRIALAGRRRRNRRREVDSVDREPRGNGRDFLVESWLSSSIISVSPAASRAS